MYTVNNAKDLADAYEDLYFYKTQLGDLVQRSDAVKAHVEKIKRLVRQYHKKQSDRRCVWQDENSYTERIDVPAEVATLAEAEEWFDCMERIEYTPCEYDCTGQAFTSWHHIGILGGKMVCWHHVCYDV